MTIAGELARYAAGLKFEDLPAEVVHQAKRSVLDTFGCAIAAFPSDASQILQSLAQDLGGKRESTIIGSGIKTTCLNALLANGAMVRYFDLNDTYAVAVRTFLTGCHPSEVIPTAVALAERQHLTGRDVITAIVVGYQLMVRFTDAVTSANTAEPTLGAKGWMSDSIGAFVMPLVAGKLLGLSETQMENAMGISGSLNMIMGILDSPGEEFTMTKNLRLPHTAYGGTKAALMAQKGFTGPVRVIEGKKGFIEAVTRGDFNLTRLTEPRAHFSIMDMYYKPIAADANTHGHVSATLQLVKEHDIKPEDVAEVSVWASSRCVEHTGDPVKRYPKNQETANHSSYYLTAVAITDRAVGPEQYTPQKLEDPRIRELIGKVTFTADPSLDSFRRAGISEIRTRQGATFRARVEYPKGDPSNPMSDEELQGKFRSLVASYMNERQIRRAIKAVYDLDKTDNIDEVMKTVVFASISPGG